MNEVIPTTLTLADAAISALVIWIAATLTMLVYSYRSNKGEFDFTCWLHTNVNRFKVGSVMILGISTLNYLVPDISALLQTFGVNANSKAPLMLGIAIGGFLIAGVSGKPTLGNNGGL